MKETVIGIALGVVLAGAGIAAGHGFGGRKEKLTLFDKDGDGVLSDAERAAMKEAFAARRAAKEKEALARFDKNKNGLLDPAERDEMRRVRTVERFQSIDADKNGVISFAEFEAHAKSMKRGHR
jgi:Ca2+-binding EF-hand superfamily protein